MRNNQKKLGVEGTEKSELSIDNCNTRNTSPDASHVKIADTSRARRQAKRWVPHRKAEIVAAVRGGFLNFDEARERYELSIEEFLAWQRGIDLFGLAGLRVNRTQQHRRTKLRSTNH